MNSAARRGFVAAGGALAAAALATVVAWRTQQSVRAEQQAADLSSAIADLAVQHRKASAGLREHIEAMSNDLAERIASLEAARTQTDDERHRGLTSRIDRVHREARQLYGQLEALLDLRAQLQPRGPLPPLRGWAASPDVLHWMLTWAQYHQPRLIVECGSGVSTVLFGYHVQRAGTGQVIALEHDHRFAAQTRELAERHGVDDVVEVRDAPLQEWQYGERTWRWYDQAAVEDIVDIDLLFIDGPPEPTGPMARFPAGPILLDRLAPSGVAVLDDARRADESRASDLWLEELPALERESLKTDKGTDVFRRHVG